MNKAVKTLRELAKIYKDFSMEERNVHRVIMHQKVNDLESERPVVLIDEVPWCEMNFDGSLTLVSKDPVLQGVEDYLRKKIFQYKYFPADMVLRPYLPIPKLVKLSSIGIQVEEETLDFLDNEHIVSHKYEDQFKEESDLDKLVLPTVTYEKEETLRRMHLVQEVIGDIIPVQLSGVGCYYVVTWDDLSRYRGVTPLLMDLIDRPELIHRLVRKLTNIELHKMNQFEKLGLLDNNPETLHCTAAATKDLPPIDDSGMVKRENIWGRGAAQILASASKAMRDEFDIEYMKETVGKCGLVYYGCCEPLDKMIDVVEKIPNLRKISITPWADIDVAAEVINSRYVIASKPNPASVASKNLNEEGLKNELSKILNACKKNRSHADIVLKDISTTHNNPENIFKWEKIAMNMVMNY